jgi:hypothetical protein
MSYNGSGTFQINTTGQPVVTGTVISATTFNSLTADLATGLSTAITKDGQTTTTARIPFAAGITSTLVTDATSTGSGSIITAGGVGIAKNLYVGVNANVAGTLVVTGVATFSATPIYSSLTASSAVATDASKALVSVTNTGTGSNVLATSPTINNPTVTNYVESVVAIGNSSTAVTLALTNGTVQTVTMTGNCTFTMPTATAGKSFVLIVSSGAGGFTGTFTSVKWPNNGAPTLTTTASRWDILTFFADGTNWYGTFAQAFQ